MSKLLILLGAIYRNLSPHQGDRGDKSRFEVISTISMISTGKGYTGYKGYKSTFYMLRIAVVAPCRPTGATNKIVIKQSRHNGCRPCRLCRPTYGGVQHGL